MKKLSIFIIINLSIISSSFAQDFDIGNYYRPSQYILGDKDEILIKVNIWGYVRKPGQYLVPRHTDLISLISFAGGPLDGANLEEVRLLQEKRIEGNGHFETDGIPNSKPEATIKKINIKKYIETGATAYMPTLKANDTVVVAQTFGNKMHKFLGFNSVFSMIAAGASIALIVERLSR